MLSMPCWSSLSGVISSGFSPKTGVTTGGGSAGIFCFVAFISFSSSFTRCSSRPTAIASSMIPSMLPSIAHISVCGVPAGHEVVVFFHVVVVIVHVFHGLQTCAHGSVDQSVTDGVRAVCNVVWFLGAVGRVLLVV